MKRETVYYFLSFALWAGVGAIGAVNDISMAVPIMIILATLARHFEKGA